MKQSLLLCALLMASCKDERPIEKFTQPQGKASFDHSAYDALLGKYVDERGRVNYAAWKKDDMNELDRYLDRVRSAAPSQMDRSEALAFWIDVYNAWTLRGILEFYPVKSIKDKVSRVVGYNIWDDYKIKIEGKDLSLNDMEHRILRKMSESRVHFALVCAAKGCPRLLNQAYTGKKLDEQLETNARHFFAQSQNFQLDRAKNVVRLSSILSWYKDDFGKTDKERLEVYSKHLSSADREFVRGKDLVIEFIEYDWTLNEQEKTR